MVTSTYNESTGEWTENNGEKKERRVSKRKFRMAGLGKFRKAGRTARGYSQTRQRDYEKRLPPLLKRVYHETGIKKKRVKGKRGKGRPKGPSGKYYIPGVGPVGVYEWRRWYARKLATDRMRQAQRQAGLPPSKIYQPREQYTAPPRRVVQEQVRATVSDNILHAPQFMRGDMRRSEQLNRSDNILNAPQFLKGEMRGASRESPNIIGRVSGQTADQLPTPVSNPMGDVYLDVDPLTGKHLYRKRPREKWLAGRQL